MHYQIDELNQMLENAANDLNELIMVSWQNKAKLFLSFYGIVNDSPLFSAVMSICMEGARKEMKNHFDAHAKLNEVIGSIQEQKHFQNAQVNIH